MMGPEQMESWGSNNYYTYLRLPAGYNPDDLESLQRFAAQHAEQASTPAHVKLIEDPSISRGGVVVITATGEIDATLDQQVEQIARALTPGSED